MFRNRGFPEVIHVESPNFRPFPRRDAIPQRIRLSPMKGLLMTSDHRFWLRPARLPRTGTRIGAAILSAIMLLASVGCQAQETHRSIETESVVSKGVQYNGPRHKIALGNVQNKSPYMQGIFSDGKDRLGVQARQILMTHLTQTRRFIVLDRMNMEELAAEAKLSGEAQAVQGAKYVVTAAVTEFGRRETGTQALGGVISKSRKQTAYAKVSLSVVDVKTTQAIYSVQGAGEFDLTNEQIVGFGATAGYDATLTDKVLNLAMLDVVNKLVKGLESGEWEIAR